MSVAMLSASMCGWFPLNVWGEVEAGTVNIKPIWRYACHYERTIRIHMALIGDAKPAFGGVLNIHVTAFSDPFANFAAIGDIWCFFVCPFSAQSVVCRNLSQSS